MIKLTEQQEQAFAKIVDFLNSPGFGVFILKGYAGTGKTTLLSFVVKYLNARGKQYSLLAPTGRAAKVLQDKTQSHASTIHRHIYKFDNLEEKTMNPQDENDVEGVEFFYPLKSTDFEQHLYIVDEASMIGTRRLDNEFLHFGTGSLLQDLITFAFPMGQGKIVFIGDYAQLPPVGDANSNALDENYFKQRNIPCESFELTEIVRQSDDSLILKNSISIRNALSNDMCRTLQFETKKGEFESLESIVNTICDNVDDIKAGRSMVITYSNEDAKQYNDVVRDKIFPGISSICVGDRIMIARNHYTSEKVLYNGEFARVSFVADESESQSAPIYVYEDGRKVRKVVELKFRDVSLHLENGDVMDTKIIETLLDSKYPSLTRDESKALYVNFLMRHDDIRGNKKRLKEAVMTDPYFNALRVKYGYAITCHKAQGGEWATVFSDMQDRKGLDRDCLRWIYTAITRAKTRFAAASLPFVTKASSLKINEIVSIAKMNADLLSNVIAPSDTPYHSSSAPAGVKAKYQAVIEALQGSEYELSKIETRPYLEMYHIKCGNSVVRYDGRYDKSGWVSFKNVPDARLSKILNDNSKMRFNLDYQPSTKVFEQLYDRVKEGACAARLTIASIQEQRSSYKIIYNMIGEESVIRVEFFFDGKGSITYAAPGSTLGGADAQLKELLNHIR